MRYKGQFCQISYSFISPQKQNRFFKTIRDHSKNAIDNLKSNISTYATDFCDGLFLDNSAETWQNINEISAEMPGIIIFLQKIMFSLGTDLDQGRV